MRGTRRRVLGLLLIPVLVLAVAAGGCTEQILRRMAGTDEREGGQAEQVAPPQRREGAYGGVWRERLPQPVDTLDPARAVTVADGRAASLLFNGLVRLDPEGRLAPDLAREWTVLEQGRVYEVSLRRGVRFHDGSMLTAADVVYSFRRLLDPARGSPRSWVLRAVAGAQAFAEGVRDDLPGIEAVGEHAVRITLARPFAQFPFLLATPAAYVVAEGGGAGADRPVGTGPFRAAGREEDGSLVLEAFEDYYAGRPYLDGVRLEVLREAEQVEQAFLSGGLHTVDLSPDAARRLTDEAGWTGPVEKIGLPAVYYVALNNQREPLTDPLVRRALNHAVDRRRLLEEILPGGYRLANGSIPPGVPGHDPDAPALAYDPERARQLLKQAGYGDGFRLDGVQSPSALARALNEGLASMLAEVGVEMRLRTLAAEDFYAAAGRDGEVDAFVISWWADYPDGENFLYPLFHSDHWGAGGNRAKFASPDADRMLEQLHTVAEADARASLYRQVERAVFERAPWIPLFFPVRYVAVQPAVRGYRPAGIYHAQKLWGVWLEEERGR